MIRLGGTASQSHMEVFKGLKTLFQRRGIELDWVLYSDYDALVEGFVGGEIDLAWNGPLSYVKIKRRLESPCRVIAMRDVDIGYVTHFITKPGSDIATVEDLLGKRFAFASRGSVEAGLLAYYFLKQVGINPRRDLSACTFYEERVASSLRGEQDVIQRVQQGDYDAGSVSNRTLERMLEEGDLARDAVRIFWSSPGYSHCCFTAQDHLDDSTYREIAQAFVSVDDSDPMGKSVLEWEACEAFVPGITDGWEALEVVAEEEGLI